MCNQTFPANEEEPYNCLSLKNSPFNLYDVQQNLSNNFQANQKEPYTYLSLSNSPLNLYDVQQNLSQSILVTLIGSIKELCISFTLVNSPLKDYDVQQNLLSNFLTNGEEPWNAIVLVNCPLKGYDVQQRVSYTLIGPFRERSPSKSFTYNYTFLLGPLELLEITTCNTISIVVWLGLSKAFKELSTSFRIATIALQLTLSGEMGLMEVSLHI